MSGLYGKSVVASSIVTTYAQTVGTLRQRNHQRRNKLPMAYDGKDRPTPLAHWVAFTIFAATITIVCKLLLYYGG